MRAYYRLSSMESRPVGKVVMRLLGARWEYETHSPVQSLWVSYSGKDRQLHKYYLAHI